MWRSVILFLVFLHGATSPAAAVIMGFSPLKIDFTKPDQVAAQKITWADPEHLGVTVAGFGWVGDAKSSRDGWIETQPIGIGTSWRPTHRARILIKLQPIIRQS
jgi:hypothetical protein